MNTPHLQPYFWMLSGCAWFSWMGILTHSVARFVDWQMVTLFRSGLAVLFAVLLAKLAGVKLVYVGPRILWVRSIAGSCSMLATFYALTHMPVSDVLTLTNTFPIWVAILSWPLIGERPGAMVWLAVISAVLGVAISQQADLSRLTWTHAMAIIASGFTAVAMLGLNRLRGIESLAVVVHFSAVSTLFCALAYWIFPRSDIGWTPLLESSVWFRLLGVGVTATIGQMFLTKAFRAGVASKVAVIGLSQVVMVMTLEAVLDGRSFNAWQIAGTVLILAPTGYLMTRERRKPSQISIVITPEVEPNHPTAVRFADSLPSAKA